MDSIEAVSALSETHVFYAGNGFAAARSRRGVFGTFLGADMGPAADIVAERLGSNEAIGGRH
jgi:hypothetical protein